MSKNLNPCQIGFVEETIDYLESIKLSKFFCPSEHKYVDYAIDAVRRAASKATEPLTLEELREMDGEPIWYTGAKGAEWCIIRVINRLYFAQSGGSDNCNVNADTYGKTWLAYRRPPEGGAG